MSFKEKLTKLRKGKHITQEQLADMLSVSRQAVSKWESGSTYPETEKIIELSRIFDCSIDYLLKDEEKVKNIQPVKQKQQSFFKRKSSLNLLWSL